MISIEQHEIEINRRYYIGLDLGQTNEFSALAVLDRTEDPLGDEHSFICGDLVRWPMRTSYQQIIADTVRKVKQINLLNPHLPRRKETPALIVDVTAVGEPVLDMLKRENLKGELMPVYIVNGNTITSEDGIKRIPKRDLVSTIQVALQNRRFEVAGALEHAPTLVSELNHFRAKITDSDDQYGAWREGKHDDLVFATALALWAGSRPIFRVDEGTRRLFEGLSGRRW